MVTEEEILKRRMQEQYLANAQAAAQQQQIEATLKIITSQILDAKARERLSNLKVVKPDVAVQLEMYLAQLYQAGQLRTRLTDEQLVMILKKLTPRRETTIRRK